MKQTSICLRVFATSSGHVAPAARVPATKPAEKFAPRTLNIPASSPPTKLRSFLLVCKAKVKAVDIKK
jgi:hypothetical protein